MRGEASRLGLQETSPVLLQHGRIYALRQGHQTNDLQLTLSMPLAIANARQEYADSFIK